MTENSSWQSTEDRAEPAGADLITRRQVRDILAECMAFPETAGDDAPVTIDSYTAAWIQHLLEERHGLVVQFSHDISSSLTSVGDVHTFVSQAARGTGQAGTGQAGPGHTPEQAPG